MPEIFTTSAASRPVPVTWMVLWFKRSGLLEEGRSSLTRLAGQWEGDASMSWQEAQNRWDVNSNELNQALAEPGACRPRCRAKRCLMSIRASQVHSDSRRRTTVGVYIRDDARPPRAARRDLVT